jgi:hypothetical protein
MSNDYIINWSNGTLKPPFSLAGNAQDTTTTSLVLTGKGSSNWGEPLQENQLKLLEHFASDVAPANPTVGQLWYDSATTTLKMYEVGGSWKPIYSLNSVSRSSAPLAPSNGQLWYDTVANVLKHFNGSEWIPIYSSTSLTNEIAPTSPKVGQLWYRSSISTLHIWNGTQWIVIFTGNSISSATAPSTPVRGQLWFDTVNNLLKIYDNTNAFVPIGGGAIAIVGDLNMNNYKIINLSPSTTGTGAVNKNQLDTAIATVTTSVTNLTSDLSERKVYRSYVENPFATTGGPGNTWLNTTFAGVGNATSWPAAWAPWFPFITPPMSTAVTVTGPPGKTYRVLVNYSSSIAYATTSYQLNSAVKILVDGNVGGSGFWHDAGDVGLMGGGGDHGWGKYQNAVGMMTSDNFVMCTSLSQTFTGTHTIEIRTYGVAQSYPGSTTYIPLHHFQIDLVEA